MLVGIFFKFLDYGCGIVRIRGGGGEGGGWVRDIYILLESVDSRNRIIIDRSC